MTATPLAPTILNALSAHIAIFDENGVILETNRAWRAFAPSNSLRPGKALSRQVKSQAGLIMLSAVLISM